jgi:hypothetical protein
LDWTKGASLEWLSEELQNLDNAASTPCLKPVLDKVEEFWD